MHKSNDFLLKITWFSRYIHVRYIHVALPASFWDEYSMREEGHNEEKGLTVMRVDDAMMAS